MSRSWKIAVSQQHERGGGLEDPAPEMLPCRKKGPSLSCPAAPTPLPLPPPGLTGRGLTGARHHLLTCPVHRRLAKITADTCQAIQPRGQRSTGSTKLLRTMELRRMLTCDQCHAAALREN
ncbi:hypothetical protein NQZ68_020565 [Dissostichus eleginoides]|nr:hypothetical protein NQZ68_020565 [Dissostichus eleginoides]